MPAMLIRGWAVARPTCFSCFWLPIIGLLEFKGDPRLEEGFTIVGLTIWAVLISPWFPIRVADIPWEGDSGGGPLAS